LIANSLQKLITFQFLNLSFFPELMSC